MIITIVSEVFQKVMGMKVIFYLALGLAFAKTTFNADTTGEELFKFLESHKNVPVEKCPGGSNLGALTQWIRAKGENYFTAGDTCVKQGEIVRCELLISDHPQDKNGNDWTLAFEVSAEAPSVPSHARCQKESFKGQNELEDFDPASMESCRSKYLSEEIQSAPTAVRRELNVLAQKCALQAMNRRLDEKLVPMKKASPQEFKEEMAIQKEFNSARNKYCEQWNQYYQNCCSTCSDNEFSDCQMDLMNWRFENFPGNKIKAISGKTILSKQQSQSVGSHFKKFMETICKTKSYGAQDSEACFKNVQDSLQAAIAKGKAWDSNVLKCKQKK